MTKIDFRKIDKPFYSGKVGRWDRLAVPEMSFLAIDGRGDPGGPAFAAAIAALYAVAYKVKFARKAAGTEDFTVGPLEALWWAEDMADFQPGSGGRERWQWRAVLRMPGDIGPDAVEAARAVAAKALAKKPAPACDAATLARVAPLRFAEGDCLQTLHVGSYLDEAPVLARLHGEVIPGLGLRPAGLHHEIYLSDPRRTAPEKLRTILRQPVAPAEG
ncbi:GyrI-like domain-containing protein [Acidimangrovimonas pyrenivorans]|uniref:GyrI-like domain-containing protein n=1 Tax=Acidimangrovimonas pyrenivorans TaxID=2030798 RepID=A0ABV7AHG2_9RHOB